MTSRLAELGHQLHRFYEHLECPWSQDFSNDLILKAQFVSATLPRPPSVKRDSLFPVDWLIYKPSVRRAAKEFIKLSKHLVDSGDEQFAAWFSLHPLDRVESPLSLDVLRSRSTSVASSLTGARIS
ncbi:uncharacterized protein LDX57_003673 [Aspergillus melleus]|uniref:uncharacterized protein n=1 Tax=Aspergillus melleus TaxID=138277 RepID=UPI001E8E703E|nr:uncharacterized protein LDX57_003673 [Aspergillus melleus]KAH8425934.1 hypothetical protein LDX57_003673 [Aspergillus melleus]